MAMGDEPVRIPSFLELQCAGIWRPAEQHAIEQRTKYTAVGSAETIRRRVEEVVARTQPDEIIALAQIYDHAARLRSFEIAADVFKQLA